MGNPKLIEEVNAIKRKAVKDRTEKEHLIMVKVCGGVRNYLLSMGKFKDDLKKSAV